MAHFGTLRVNKLEIKNSPMTYTASKTLTEREHANKTILISGTGTIVMTLPASSGKGARYNFIISTASTGSDTHTIQVGNSTDVFEGGAVCIDDDTEGAGTTHSWNAETNDDTITLNADSTGGKLGDRILVIDYAAGHFHVWAQLTESGGSEVTPFSAAV